MREGRHPAEQVGGPLQVAPPVGEGLGVQVLAGRGPEHLSGLEAVHRVGQLGHITVMPACALRIR